MEQPVYEAVAPRAIAVNDRACARKLHLQPSELTYWSDMDAEVTFDSADRSMSPGTAVLAVIEGRAGIVRIHIDDRTGTLMASERQRVWPVTSIEPMGRVVEVRWRP